MSLPLLRQDSIPAELKNRLIIKVEKAKTVELVERAVELTSKEPQESAYILNI